ncbi:MAG: hypothetical protein BWX45_01194 [Deltaproteobacteria bacterium ADurb.Bin002]|nr:MAG: hypothetical protein BWX45_01194 [Deltaproteobacteria bacterium ADurb.Bin002]
MLNPSNVEVPRPTSSRMTRLRGVASVRICAVSIISTINVLWPLTRLSDAPIRVKILSTTPMRAREAGTKLPICARSTIRATCRIYVDFPAMLGPVMTSRRFCRKSSSVSLGTNPSFLRAASTTGWRPS